MICKSCGAIIRHNEEYCRKCGSLVINFNKEENKSLRNVCVENNLRGKLRSIANRLFNTEKKQHDVTKINKQVNSEKSISDMSKKISNFINEHIEYDTKVDSNEDVTSKSIKGYEDFIGNENIKNLVDMANKFSNKKRW